MRFTIFSVLQQVLDWREWDHLSIIYGAVATLLAALILWICGGFRRIGRLTRRTVGARRFNREMRAACESLIAVGRREGFRLDDVYVPLDIAPSTLDTDADKHPWLSEDKSFVLLGGPGAGKSTWAKKRVRDWAAGQAYLVRLRDLGAGAVVEHLAGSAKRAGIPDPEVWVERHLRKSSTLVVLDGLDEVRAQDWDATCREIDAFYRMFAAPDDGVTLIVTCRKEAYRTLPLAIPQVREVRPLTDQQIERFAAKWPLGYPDGKNPQTFLRDLQGSERILELARSPLMLVGALMQYTESNLGIPEERNDYLERIARWLLEDWARAQGHPPDPWRKAYEPVLSGLAFAMHSRGVAEMPRDEGVRLIRRTLPAVGVDGGKADAFVESLASKTGILVRDTPGHLVFAQFSLQEYFAAAEAAATLKPAELNALEPLSWWREAILLTVARQPKPEDHFEALFARDQLLGAAAVAEYPTPPMTYQGRAVAACLTAIDGGIESVVEPAIALSRKVEGKHKRNLIDGLEERIVSADEVAVSSSGRILAMSGTPEANEALGRNPSSWSAALVRAGFLSSSFEDLLVGWIMGKDSARATMAAEIILKRLSDDRREQLLTALPELPVARAEALARGLVASLDNEGALPWRVDRKLVRLACHCAPYLRSPEGLTGHSDSFAETGLTISKIAAIIHAERRYEPTKLVSVFLSAARWADLRPSFFWWVASAALLTSMNVSSSAAALLLGASALLSLLGLVLGQRPVPWVQAYLGVEVRLLLAALIGSAFTWILAPSIALPSQPAVEPVLVGAVLLSALAVVPRFFQWRFFPRSGSHPRLLKLQFGWAGSLIGLLGMAIFLPETSRVLGAWMGVAMAVGGAVLLAWHWADHRLVRAATKTALGSTPSVYISAP